MCRVRDASDTYRVWGVGYNGRRTLFVKTRCLRTRFNNNDNNNNMIHMIIKWHNDVRNVQESVAIIVRDASCALQNSTIILSLLLLLMHTDLVRFYAYKPIRIWIMSFICINDIYISRKRTYIYRVVVILLYYCLLLRSRSSSNRGLSE